MYELTTQLTVVAVKVTLVAVHFDKIVEFHVTSLEKLKGPPGLDCKSSPHLYNHQQITMGYKAKHKQAPPRPLPGSTEPGKPRRRDKGKKRASAPADERSSVKALASGGRHKQKVLPGKKRRKVDEVAEDEDDSDLEDALKQG